MVFFMEIYRNGECINDCFQNWVKEHGAKVSNFWSSKVTHFVWSGGKLQNISKAAKDSVEKDTPIEIVQPIWISESIKKEKLEPVHEYRPLHLDQLLKDSKKLDVKNIKAFVTRGKDLLH